MPTAPPQRNHLSQSKCLPGRTPRGVAGGLQMDGNVSFLILSLFSPTRRPGTSFKRGPRGVWGGGQWSSSIMASIQKPPRLGLQLWISHGAIYLSGYDGSRSTWQCELIEATTSTTDTPQGNTALLPTEAQVETEDIKKCNKRNLNRPAIHARPTRPFHYPSTHPSNQSTRRSHPIPTLCPYADKTPCTHPCHPASAAAPW